MTFRKRTYVSLIVFVFVVLSALAQEQPASAADFTIPVRGPFTFIAYGDVRFTNPSDNKSSSPEYRDALVAEIAKERPSLVAFVGDLVRQGALADDWDVMEKELAPLGAAGIPLYPVIGNHETWGDPQAENYFRHFPQLQRRHWYTVQAGNCYFVMLDSVSLQPNDEQWKWLAERLQQIPRGVDYVFIVQHHPLMTRSSEKQVGGGHPVRPQEEQLAAFLEQQQHGLRQPIIVLAGHVHSYERYVRGRVTYITTGGGGATPYTIPRMAADKYKDPGPAYHFCRFVAERGSLRFEMAKLSLLSGQPQFAVRDSFRLRVRPTRAAKAAAAR